MQWKLSPLVETNVDFSASRVSARTFFGEISIGIDLFARQADDWWKWRFRYIDSRPSTRPDRESLFNWHGRPLSKRKYRRPLKIYHWSSFFSPRVCNRILSGGYRKTGISISYHTASRSLEREQTSIFARGSSIRRCPSHSIDPSLLSLPNWDSSLSFRNLRPSFPVIDHSVYLFIHKLSQIRFPRSSLGRWIFDKILSIPMIIPRARNSGKSFWSRFNFPSVVSASIARLSSFRNSLFESVLFVPFESFSRTYNHGESYGIVSRQPTNLFRSKRLIHFLPSTNHPVREATVIPRIPWLGIATFARSSRPCLPFSISKSRGTGWSTIATHRTDQPRPLPRGSSTTFAEKRKENRRERFHLLLSRRRSSFSSSARLRH